MVSCRSGKGSNHRPRIDQLPHDILVAIFKFCDPVTISRCSRVCTTFRRTIEKESKMDEPQFRTQIGFGRLFILDRRRVILERIMCGGEGAGGVGGKESLTSSPSSSTIRPYERSLSHSTSASSNHSIHEFLDSIYEKPKRRLKDRLARRSSRFEADHMASTAEAAWAYKFDLDEWKRNFDIVEVCLQNFASFLERDKGRMAEASVSMGEHSFSPTPPWSGHSSPEGMASSLSHSSLPTRYHTLASSRPHEPKRTVHDSLTDEMKSECRLLSSGRFERLAVRLGDIHPLHLVFRDHSLYQRRPIALLFWFISLLRVHLRRLTLDGIQGGDSIRLDGALSLENIESLTIRQPSESPAIIANEDVLLSWLHLPSSSRSPIRVRFQNCRRLSPGGMCRFIREWQVYPEVAVFDMIIVDEDSMHPWELIEEAEKEQKKYPKNDDYVRPLQMELPAYLTSEKERRTDEQRESYLRSMEFRHKKGGRAIRYHYEDGMLVFSCVEVSSRPHSPPSPSSLSTLHNSSYNRSFPSRPGSLPRDSSFNNPPLIHSYHPPPSSPGMFGRLIQILRSNA